MSPKSQNKLKYSDITSLVEGQDLGEMRKLWQDITASEVRVQQMSVLKGKKLGSKR